MPALQLDSIYDLIAGNSLNKVRFEDRIRNVFGLVDYRFNDAWSVSAEARYGDEDKEIFRITNATGGAFTAGAAYQAQAYEPLTWRTSVNYRPMPGVLTYLSAAKGEKTGGFNVARYPAFLGQGEFEAETNTTYELGIKSDWLNKRLRLNAAVYVIDWKDLQASTPQFTDDLVLRPLTPQDPAIISNIGGAESTGVELELGYIFTPHFNATLAFAYNDPKYKNARFFAANAIAPVGTPTRDNPPLGNIRCDGVLCAANGSVDGNSLERQSKALRRAAAELRPRPQRGLELLHQPRRQLPGQAVHRGAEPRPHRRRARSPTCASASRTNTGRPRSGPATCSTKPTPRTPSSSRSRIRTSWGSASGARMG